jgi:TatD DNase family protein
MSYKDTRPTIVDTHVHLQYDRYAGDLDGVLDRAAEAGVTKVIVPGTTLEDSRRAIALTERYAQASCTVFATVGIHPTHAYNLPADTLPRLRELAHHPNVVAIGETGLDYYWPQAKNRDWPCPEPTEQRDVLRLHLDLAAELDLPVIIHDRDAHEDTLRIVRTWLQGGERRGGTLHAYAAGPQYLDEVTELGLYIGIDGPVTFKKAESLHQVARRVDLNHLLLETDGPYLTPAPHRGKRNEPAYLTYVAEHIATLRSKPVEEIYAATTRNAARLFNL